jgi:hypothetical protein
MSVVFSCLGSQAINLFKNFLLRFSYVSEWRWLAVEIVSMVRIMLRIHFYFGFNSKLLVFFTTINLQFEADAESKKQ